MWKSLGQYNFVGILQLPKSQTTFLDISNGKKNHFLLKHMIIFISTYFMIFMAVIDQKLSRVGDTNSDRNVVKYQNL